MPDYYAHMGRVPELTAVCATFLALSTVAVALRVYVRCFMVKAFGVDDYAAVIGWVLFACNMGTSFHGLTKGSGTHLTDIRSLDDMSMAFRDWWLGEVFYLSSGMAIKLSVGLTLLRFVTDRTQRMIIWVTIGVVEVFSFTLFMLVCFQCSPAKFFWTRVLGDTNGTCMPVHINITATYVYSVILCISDWTFAILPWFLVRNLNMNIRTKIMVAGVLAVGSVASAATVIRFPYIATFYDVKDFLYATSDIAMWSTVETGLSITASSAAMLKPLFKEFMSHTNLFGGTTKRSKDNSMPLTEEAYGKNSKYNFSSRKYIHTSSADPSLYDAEDERALAPGQINVTKTIQVSVDRVR